jgi:cobalt-zinc-cadmium efflux system outer membrane protein
MAVTSEPLKHRDQGMRSPLTIVAAFLAVAPVACVSRDMPIDDARSEVHARTGMRARWSGAPRAEDDKLRKSLLAQPLTARSAAQIALLGSPEVDAALEETGVARGALIGALALPNPEAEVKARFHGDEVELELGASLDIVELFLIPARESAASDAIEASRLEAAASVLDVAFEAKVALYDYVAAEQALELRKTILYATAQASELATKLLEAGNIPELGALAERAVYEDARLAVTQAELEVISARERVNRVLGLHGAEAASWRAAHELPAPDNFDPRDLEPKALEKSLDLAVLKKRYAAAASRVNLGWAEGLVPGVAGGVSAERHAGAWAVGPAVSVSLPIFYQGQGEVAAAEAEMRVSKSRHEAASLRIRASARRAGARMRTARESAAFYESTLLPLRQRVLDETLRQYNAMNTGPFEVLAARRAQADAAERTIEVLRDYWVARAEVEQLLAGRLPASEDPPRAEDGATEAPR